MADFSIDECMEKLNIQDGSRLEKMRALYCALDRLIEHERLYLAECIVERLYNHISDVDRDVWRGIELRAVKMGMEAELGGAIKQDIQVLDTSISVDKQGVNGKIYWASMPERAFEFTMLFTLTEEEKAQARKELANGTISKYCNILSLDSGNITDAKRQFDHDCDLMDWDAISLKPSSCYHRGIGINLQMAIEDDKMADKLENEYLSYKKMSLSERSKDFDSFLQEIRYVNGLAPRPIVRHNDTTRGNNQNQRG